MGVDDIPLFQMLKGRLGYLDQRQKVIAANVANVNTPNYTPSDLKPFSFQAQLKAVSTGLAPTQTNPAHIGGSKSSAAASGGTVWAPQKAPDSEATLDGNQVVLEDEMIKMTDARTNYDAAVTFYQQAMNLLRTAGRRPNQG